MDRTLAPAFRTLVDFELPTPEKINLGSDKPPILYLPYTQTPIVKIEFVFAAGKLYEAQPGLAQFTVNLLDKGTSSNNAKEIASTLDYYGALLELTNDADFAYISLYCLSDHIKILLPLVISILSEPSFPEEELNTYKQIFTENLKVNQGKNSYLATVALRKAIFKKHPYGRNTEIEDALRITKQHVEAFFKKHYNLLSVFVTGSINEPELSTLSKFCNGFSKTHSSQSIDFIELAVEDHTFDGPGKDQASIRFGKITLDRKNKQIANLTLLNHILGGFFGSRLMKNIREEKGLTYGIYSSISHFKQASLFSIGAEVNTQNVEEAKREILTEISKLQNISGEEVQIAKNHLIGSMQNDNASIFNIAERIKVVELNGLNADYYSALSKAINSCSGQELVEIAQIELNPSSLCAVVVK